ncbi:DUF1206 domain-containing protein [Leucobacter allii]|uniref:DUF1206 domain-containing protein n=1 Tax=Leucobacter allii TaxID=2932247 RepID=UPI001FD341FE|nr:DUF1206 domain-containing protein [Leucobacter allii]UOR01684.1 DUF1206 domain-containing protein [Leucobacter allii]
MDERVRAAAETAERSTPLRVLARGGYAASGVVHGLIGVLALLLIAQHGRSEADQVGALAAIAASPLGAVVVWLLAALLCGLGVFHAAHGLALRRSSPARRRARRASEWGQAVAFLVMGAIAVTVAVGGRPDPDERTRDASRGLLTMPGGVFLLAAIGVGVGVAGVAWIVMGVMRSFRRQMSLPPGRAGRAVAALGVVGFVAKGVALLAVAVLLVAAAVQQDPGAAGALDAAITLVYRLPFGAWLVGGIGIGFVSYGVFCLLRARYAELPR